MTNILRNKVQTERGTWHVPSWRFSSTKTSKPKWWCEGHSHISCIIRELFLDELLPSKRNGVKMKEWIKSNLIVLWHYKNWHESLRNPKLTGMWVHLLFRLDMTKVVWERVVFSILQWHKVPVCIFSLPPNTIPTYKESLKEEDLLIQPVHHCCNSLHFIFSY